MTQGIAHGDSSTPYIFGRKNVNYTGGTPAHEGGMNRSLYHASSDFSSTSSSARGIPTTIDECHDILDSAADSSSPDLDDTRTQLAYLTHEYSRGSVPSEESVASDIVNDVSEPDGGATRSPISKLSPTGGFCCSPYPERSRIITSSGKQLMDDILKYGDDNIDLLTRDDHYVGLWNDPADGKVYLDVSCVTMDASEARDKCEDNDQIAYFDLQRFESVTVNEDATSGQG